MAKMDRNRLIAPFWLALVLLAGCAGPRSGGEAQVEGALATGWRFEEAVLNRAGPQHSRLELYGGAKKPAYLEIEMEHTVGIHAIKTVRIRDARLPEVGAYQAVSGRVTFEDGGPLAALPPGAKRARHGRFEAILAVTGPSRRDEVKLSGTFTVMH